MNTSQKSLRGILTFVQLILITLVATSIIKAQTSSVDLSFNAVADKNLTLSRPNFILQPDGKIVVFGDFRVVNGVLKNQIVRLNPDGSFDNSFDCATCDIIIVSVLPQPDGKILVGGGTTVSSLPQAVIYRLNPDGSRDQSFVTSFPTYTSANGYASIKAIQPDGKILVNVSLRGTNGSSGNAIYRLNANGSFDSTFTTITFQTFFSSFEAPDKVVVQPDGKIFLSGYSVTTSGSFGFLRRYNTDGTRDTSFEAPILSNTSFPAFISDYEFLPDGSLIVVGRFTSINAINRLNVAKILPAGNVDLTFNPPNVFNIGGFATGVEILSDGKILISTSNAFYRLNADGTIDNSFASPPNLTEIYSWRLDAAGKIFLYGAFTENGASVGKFARLNQNGAVESSFNNGFGTNSSITALAAQADGKTIFAGDFVRVGGVPRVSIARVNADGSLDATFNSGSGFDGAVAKILVQADGKILVVGSFYNFNGAPRGNLARLNADGSLDTSFDPNLSSATIYTVALQADGKILIGGVLSSVNGQPRTGVARLNVDGSLDATFNPIFGSSAIRSILAQSDGKILVGGSFNAVNGFSRTNLVRLNADGSLDTSFSAGNISVVSQIEVQTDGKYLILTNTIARLNNNGTADSSFLAPSISGTVNQLLLLADGSILVGGSFSQIGGVARSNFARLRPNGNLDGGFIPGGANGAVRSIGRQADGKVLIGGDFSVVGGVTRLGIARLNVSPYRLITQYDYDGDGRADLAVFRPSNGYWYILRSSNNSFAAVQFGASGDRIAPADYDGDGRTDIAVFRGVVAGAGSFAYFYILNSSDNSFRPVQFGATGDVPVAGDWDGDGRGDLAVYRGGASAGAQSFFYYRPSSQPGADFRTIQWGSSGDIPTVGDYDGDSKLDAAIFRPSIARWYILRSSNNQVINIAFGASADIPVPADFDGDGITNIAVFRPSNGTWYTSTNPQNNYGAIQFGAGGDLPVPADYDGDGRADVAVFRPSNGAWYLNRSTQGFTGVSFGAAEDKPIPNAYIR